MALIIETGAIVANANAYCSAADVRAFAEARGLELPAADSDVDALIVQATDFIASLENCLDGARQDPNQELSFPRSGVSVFGLDVSGTIPKALKQAVARLVFDASEGVDLQPTTTGQFILEEGVGPLRVKYADTSANGADARTTFNAALTFLNPLFKSSKSNSGGGFNIPVCR